MWFVRIWSRAAQNQWSTNVYPGCSLVTSITFPRTQVITGNWSSSITICTQQTEQLSDVILYVMLLGDTDEALRAKIDRKSAFLKERRQFDPKFPIEGVAPPLSNHSSSHKTRVNDLSCGIRIWAQLSFVLSQITRLTDRQTDRQDAHAAC